MLSQPIPLTPTDEIGAKSEQVVNPWPFRCGPMVGIVLDVQTDESLGDAEHNRNGYTTITPATGIREGGSGCEPVLHEEEKRNVGKGTGEESGSAIFASSAHNLRDFGLDLTFEWSVKLVPRDINV